MQPRREMGKRMKKLLGYFLLTLPLLALVTLFTLVLGLKGLLIVAGSCVITFLVVLVVTVGTDLIHD